jgi:type VI secretion system protein VasD
MTPIPRRRILLRLPAWIAVPLLVESCAAPPPPPPSIDLTIIGGADQNPDQSGRPLSVAVHLYQLVSPAKFERADVFALIEREKQTLGEDSPASEEIVIAPGQKQQVKHELKPGVQYLGVAVFFRDIDNAKWRAVAQLAPSGPTKLTLTVTGVTATLAPSG